MSPSTIGPRFVEAVGRAAEWHAGQTRKGDGPYIAHLLGVASLVLEDGGSEDEAIAGLLHDSIEDQGISAGTIDDLFGPEVARIVEACSDSHGPPSDVKPPWLDRKLHHLAHLGQLAAGDPVFRVTAADKLHNCRDLLAGVRDRGSARLAEFHGGTQGTLWYYAAMSALLGERLPGSRLTRELAAAARDLHQAAGVSFPAAQPGPGGGCDEC